MLKLIPAKYSKPPKLYNLYPLIIVAMAYSRDTNSKSMCIF